jgi:long-chain acyl-CoA synthetase
LDATFQPPVITAVQAHALATPSATALHQDGQDLTYADLQMLIAALNGRLRHLGVQPGDRVGICGLNSAEWVAAFLACIDTGAIAVPLNYRLSRHELDVQIELLGPRLVLCDNELVDAVEAGVMHAGSTLRTLVRSETGVNSVWHGPSAGAAHAATAPSEPALISFTSGSTGIPKGAVITHEGLAAAASAYTQVMATSSFDRTLVMVPLFHNTGFCDQLTHMLLVGGTVDLLPVFGTSAARAALIRRPSTFLMGVPGILRLLATGPAADAVFSACRIACYGGSPMPEAWIHDIAGRWPGLRLYNSYGLTEFTSVSHLLGPADIPTQAHTVGRPVPGVRQRIIDSDDSDVAADVVGHLLLAGPSRMKEYWRAPALTHDALVGRWLRTGDVGSVSEDGFLTLVGRDSDVINRGGEKVSPLQVEAALSLEPDITEAAVVGAPHAIFGERVVAFVALRGSETLDEEAVRQHLSCQVADYAIPERFMVVDQLPRGATGKVDRRALSEAAEAVISTDEAAG